MALIPLGDRILVRRTEEEEQTTTGGIIIPDTAKEKPQEGEVIAVGRSYAASRSSFWHQAPPGRRHNGHRYQRRRRASQNWLPDPP